MDMPTANNLASTAIKSSLYFWWWAFLRCSKDYWWCCHENGNCLDPRLVRVWNDFGDIFKYECFMHWWQDRGPKLFDSPQIEMKFKKDLGHGLQLLVSKDLENEHPEMICLVIPKYLDSSLAQSIIYEAWLLARVRGKHYTVNAKYQLFDLILRSKKTIIPAYKSLMLNVSVENSALEDQLNHWGDFEMGRHLNLSPKDLLRASDTLDRRRKKQNSVRNIFRQKKLCAADLIANVEIGIFPCKDPVEHCARWSTDQQIALDQCVAQGLWHSEGWATKEMAYMLPDKEVFYGLGNPHQTFQVLDHFASLATPFLKPKKEKSVHH